MGTTPVLIPVSRLLSQPLFRLKEPIEREDPEITQNGSGRSIEPPSFHSSLSSDLEVTMLDGNHGMTQVNEINVFMVT
jgi:hypothetical protein